MQVIHDMNELGAAIRSARREQGMTQTELAGACGTGIRFVSELERGKPTAHVGRVLHVLQLLGLQLVIRPTGSE